MNSINDIPEELIFNTFQYLSPRELAVVSLVCQRFSQIADDHMLWRQHCYRDYGVVPETEGKNFYRELVLLKRVHKICLNIVFCENYFHQMNGWTGMFQRMYHRKRVNRYVKRRALMDQKLKNSLVGELDRDRAIFHNMLNWFFGKSQAMETTSHDDAVLNFLNLPPASGHRYYCVKGVEYAFTRLKKEKEIYLLAIPSVSSYEKEDWHRLCYAELFKVNQIGSGTAIAKEFVDTLIIYEKGFNIPDFKMYRTIRALFDLTITLELGQQVEVLKGMKVDCCVNAYDV